MGLSLLYNGIDLRAGQEALTSTHDFFVTHEALRLKKERFNLRFQRTTGQLENTARVREVRRDIARIKTVAAQKRRAETKAK